MTVSTNLTQEEITNAFFSKIKMLGFFTKNDNHFFSDGHKGFHLKENQVNRSHFYLDPDVNEGIDATEYEDSIIKFAQDTNAFGVLKTGTSYHIEYLFNKPINVKYLKNHFEAYINKLYTTMSEYVDEKDFKFDRKSCSLAALDRMPLSMNPTTGTQVIWVWSNIDNRIQVSDVIGYNLLNESSFEEFSISSEKIELLKNNPLLRLINSKNDIYSEQYFREVINTISKSVYGYTQNLDKSFLCVLHKESKPSAQLQNVKGNIRYSDFHNDVSKSKDILSFIYSFLTGKDIVIDSDSYGIYFHNYINFMNIKVLSLKEKINKINECFSQMYGYLGRKHKQLKRVLESLRAIAIENENHGSSSFMASERFISNIAVLDISNTNKLMNLLVAIGFLKRVMVVEYNMYNNSYSDPIPIEEYKYNERKLFTYLYELNLSVDAKEITASLQKFFSQFNISQINKFNLVKSFGEATEKLILGVNKAVRRLTSKIVPEKKDPLEIEKLHSLNVKNIGMFANSYYKLLRIN